MAKRLVQNYGQTPGNNFWFQNYGQTSANYLGKSSQITQQMEQETLESQLSALKTRIRA